MRHSWEIKEEIGKLQSILADMQDEYRLAKARERAAYMQDMAEKAAQAARDMEGVIKTRKHKRERRRMIAEEE